jgi:hypothetical protein
MIKINKNKKLNLRKNKNKLLSFLINVIPVINKNLSKNYKNKIKY